MSLLAPELALSVDGVGKRYRIGAKLEADKSIAASIARRLASPVQNFRRLRSMRKFDSAESLDVIWALRDVTFQVRRGEVLGIVGRNGAGKSTLLKVLSRITEPTEGSAELRGRVSSLLEVGTGFHPDLTGRDNIYLNGTMLGMSRREVAGRFDEIVEFAEISKFIDTPVKRYSSGMYVRLAFSVAAHLDPDILIADEVLAVGDAEFQRKCVGQMRSVADGGRTVIFVSHNHSLISSLCTRALWLDNGRVRDEGDVDGVLERYASSFQDEESPQIGLRSDRIGSGRIKLDRVELRNGRGELLQRVATAEPLELVLDYVGEGDKLSELQVTVTAETLLREPVFTLSNRFTGERLEGLPPRGSVRCVIDELPLNEGDYMWTVRLEVDGKTADFIGDTSRFHVDPRGFFPTGTYPGAKGGPLLLRHSWHAGKARR